MIVCFFGSILAFMVGEDFLYFLGIFRLSNYIWGYIVYLVFLLDKCGWGFKGVFIRLL